MDKELFISAILGSFIGYAIFSVINGMTNNIFYRIGIITGKWIADIIKLL